MHVLFDTDVLLDYLLERRQHRRAGLLIDAVERGRITGSVSAHAVTTIYYIAERTRGSDATRDCIRFLLNQFTIAPVGGAHVAVALKSAFADFEDAVVHEAARRAGADGIVTRRVADFEASTLPVYLPAELVRALDIDKRE